MQIACPGLPADWINGWLAAVGATVLDPRLRLHWTSGGVPVAVLSASEADPVECLVESWPDERRLIDLPIAEHWREAGTLRRGVSVCDFIERARASRGHRFSWALSSTLTDLCVDEKGAVAHAPFDPAGPGTIKWLHHRLMKIHGHVHPSPARIQDSLQGRAVRVKDNGLGFDQTRLGSQSDSTSTWTDPVVEELAFFSLAILPVRGRGTDRRLDRRADIGEVQRGWRRSSASGDRRAPLSFHWPAWRQRLDRAGIDALMDAWNPERKRVWAQLGVHAGWRSVRLMRRGSADKTCAFGSEQL